MLVYTLPLSFSLLLSLTWTPFPFYQQNVTQQADSKLTNILAPNGLVFFSFFWGLMRAFFYSICTFLKNYYKHFVFYRAKTITKINGRNLTAICLANVSVRDCFLFLAVIVCLLLFRLSIAWCSVKHSIISFIRIGSLLFFCLLSVLMMCICVCMCMYDVFNLIDGIHCVFTVQILKILHIALQYVGFFMPFVVVYSVSVNELFTYQSRSIETSFVNFNHFSALFKEHINMAHHHAECGRFRCLFNLA